MRALGTYLALVGVALFASTATADNRFDLRAAYFMEGAPAQRLHVFMPSATLNVDAHKNFSINLGYAADVVSGATARTYSGQVDAVSSATKFSDVRHQAHGGAELRLGPAAISAGYTFGTENDYRSHALDVAARVDLWNKNTTFALGYSHNFDSVCNVDNRGVTPLERRALGASQGCFDSSVMALRQEAVSIDSYALSYTQVLHPLVVMDLSMNVQVIDGFQSNPYRRVRLFSGTIEAQESQPLLRQRVSGQGRLRVAIPKAKAAVSGIGRYYWDTWGIQSGTGELNWDQYLIPSLVLRLRGRFYQQTRALFYRDAGEALSYEAVGPVGQYFTGDRELSPFRNWLVGAKLSYSRTANEKGKVWKRLDEVDLHLKADLIGYDALSALPPSKARSDAPIDAVLIQLGLALLW